MSTAEIEMQPAVEAGIYELLRKRYEPPEWVWLEEVAPATGGGTRYADGVAVNLWQSRGHCIEGFEVKVSRSDWLRELKQPEKAEPVMRYCDHWWLVTEKDIVKPGELPINWGHIERRGGRLVTVVAAPKLEAKPLTRQFFASLMRRGHEQIEQIAARQWAAKHKEMLARHQVDISEAVRRNGRDLAELREVVKQFEEASGLRMNRYSGPPLADIKLAQALHALRSYGDGEPLSRLTNLAAELDRAAAGLREAIQKSGLAGGVS